MKKLFEDDDNEHFGMEKARILAAVIPVVLILLILAVMLVRSQMGKAKGDGDDLQQSIMDYADQNMGEQPAEDSAQAGSSSVVSGPEGQGEDADHSSHGDLSDPEKEGQEKGEEADAQETPSGAQSSPTPNKGAMKPGKTDYSKITFHKEEQLQDMMAYWADSNQKALNDLVYLDHYIAMSYSLRDTRNFYYYGDTNAQGQPHGKGIAVWADNQYYYGDWKDGVRSGEGTWFHYHIHFTENKDDLYTYHQYVGGWANDLPEGEGSEHYDFDESLLKESVSYVANRIGSYKAGLVDGEFYMTSIYADQSTKEWNAEAKAGSWVYRNETKDKKGNRTVYVDANDPDNYTWMQPRDNVKIGIPCLISEKQGEK